MPSSDSEAPGPSSASFEEELRHIEEEQGDIADIEAKRRELADARRRVEDLESELARARERHRRRAEAARPPGATGTGEATRRTVSPARIALGAAAGIALLLGAGMLGYAVRGAPPPAVQVSLSEAQLGSVLSSLRTPAPEPRAERPRRGRCGLRLPHDDLGLLLFFADPWGAEGCGDDEDDDVW
jgi:hypothetical protein